MNAFFKYKIKEIVMKRAKFEKLRFFLTLFSLKNGEYVTIFILHHFKQIEITLCSVQCTVTLVTEFQFVNTAELYSTSSPSVYIWMTFVC